MREPGGLEALDARGRGAWRDRVVSAFARATPSRLVLDRPDERLSETALIDWPGVPLRPVDCLGRRPAHALLDWSGRRGDEGRRRLQEEYLEWRVVRARDGRILRVELTTELPEYWRVLAGYAPQALLDAVAELACEPGIDPCTVYGEVDPFARDTTPERREEAFAAQMLDDGASSPYNTGERAICCMVQPTNTLQAMIALAAAAGVAREVTDRRSGRTRSPTAAEAIALFPQAAQQGRASDPLIAERIGRLAWEGRLIGFDDSPGIYIEGVERTRLRRPDGGAVSREWFRFSRGVAPRFQRLTVQAPAGEDLVVGDLVDSATGQQLRFGAQVAELAQLVLHLRVSPAGAGDTGRREPVAPAGCAGGRDNCTDILRAAQDLAGRT